MADYRILFEADTAKAEKDAKRLEKVADSAARDRKLNFTVPSLGDINKGFQNVGKGAEEAANNIRLVYKTSKALPGVGSDIQQFENIFTGIAKGAGIAAGAIAANNTAGKALNNVFGGVSQTIEQLVGRFAMLGFAITGIGKAADVLKAAFGGLFNETIGREIKLREGLLSTQTAVASTSKVFVGDKEITDPLEKIEALGGSIEARIESIRERSLDLAGVTSDQVIDVFNITASQIGMIGGGLKEAEDLAIQFSAALGTFGVPLYQANQEIGSILRGDITQDSLLAKKLGITNQDIANAKNQVGGVMKFLDEKLKTAVAGQKLQAQTWSGVTSNLKELQELIGQKFGKGLLDPLLAGIKSIYTWLSSIKKELFGIAESAGKTLGNLLRIASVRLTNGLVGGGDAGSGERITSMFKSAAASLQSVAQTVFAWLGQAASYAVNAILQAFNALKPALGILADSVRVLIKAFAEIKAAQFEGLVTALANIATILSPLITMAAGFVRVWAGILDLPIVQYFSSVTMQLNLFKRAGGDVLINMVGLISFMRSTGIPVLQFLFKTIGTIITAIGSVIKAFGELNIWIASFAGTIAKAVAIVSRGAAQLIGYFTQIGAQTAKVGADAQAVSANMNRFATAMAALGSKVGEVFKALSVSVNSAFAQLAQTVGPVITALKASIGSLGGVFNEITKTFGLNSAQIVTAMRGIATAAGQIAVSVSTAFRTLFASVAEVGRSLAGLGAAFAQLRASIGALVGSIVAPFVALGRAVLQAATQLYTVLQPALVKIQAALTQAGVKADELAAKLARVGAAAGTAGAGMRGMVLGFVKGMAAFLAFQLAIGVVIDLFGRYQRAQQKIAEQKEVAEAIKYLAANASKAASGMDDLTKATYDYKKALVAGRQNAIVEEIVGIEKEITKLQEIMPGAKKGWDLFIHTLMYDKGVQQNAIRQIWEQVAAKQNLIKELEKILKLTQQQAAEEAKAEANSPKGQADRIQKEAKRHEEVLNLQQKQMANMVQMQLLSGKYTSEQAKMVSMQQELTAATDKWAAKRSELEKVQKVNPADVDTIRKLNTELAELEGRKIDIQIRINKEQFDLQLAALRRDTESKLSALGRERQLAQSNLSVTQARYQVEAQLLRNNLQNLDLQLAAARSEGERLAIVQRVYAVQLRLNQIEYEGAVASINASIEEARLAETELKIKLKAAQVEEALARAKGQWNIEFARSVQLAREALELQVGLTNNIIKVAGYQKQVAELQLQSANLTAKTAYDSSRLEQSTRNIAANGSSFASSMKQAGDYIQFGSVMMQRMTGSFKVIRPGLEPWMEEIVAQARRAAYRSERDPLRSYAAGQAAEARVAGYFLKIMGQQQQKQRDAQQAEWEKQFGKIPQFAAGGIVNKPTIAMIGEGGEREFVIPESQMAAASSRYLSGYRNSDLLGGSAVPTESAAPNISIRTGPVMEFDGQRYVTLGDFESGLRQVADKLYRGLRTPAARYATGVR